MYEFIINLGTFVGILIILKSMTVGSDFNILIWLKFRKEYREWYFKRQTFPQYLREKLVTIDPSQDGFFLIENLETILNQRNNELLLFIKSKPDMVKLIEERYKEVKDKYSSYTVHDDNESHQVKGHYKNVLRDLYEKLTIMS